MMKWLEISVAVALVALGCEEYRQPEAFRASGDAELAIAGEVTLHGSFQAEYYLENHLRTGGATGREVRLHRLQLWMEDGSVVIPRVGRDRVQPLRCTELANDGPIFGLVESTGSLVLYEGGAIVGVSYNSRNASGGCPGEGGGLSFQGATDRRLTGRHDPVANEFQVGGSFEVEVDDEEYDGHIELTGFFLNRPPTARIASIAPGLFDHSQGGCPPVTGVNPEGVDSNHPGGLMLILQSVSYDPDSEFMGSDIVQEQWARYRGRPDTPGVPYEFLGRGRRIGPVLFEAELEHSVLLTVADRHDARNTELCTFYVRPFEP